MKNLTVAVLALASIGMSFAQSHPMAMKGHNMSAMMSGKPSPAMNTMMNGLTAAEKKTAAAMMAKMSPAEKAVIMKKATMCMNDPHKGMSMGKKPTQDMMMKHMMMGLTKSEQATMMGLMKKSTPAEAAVGQKMMMNCCVVGMKHGMPKMRGSMMKKS